MNTTKKLIIGAAALLVIVTETQAYWQLIKFNDGTWETCDFPERTGGEFYTHESGKIDPEDLRISGRNDKKFVTDIYFTGEDYPRELDLRRQFNAVTNIFFVAPSTRSFRVNGVSRYRKIYLQTPFRWFDDRKITVWYDPDYKNNWLDVGPIPFESADDANIEVNKIKEGMIKFLRTKTRLTIIWKGHLEITDGIGKDWISYEPFRWNWNVGVIHLPNNSNNGRGSMFFRIKPELSPIPIPMKVIENKPIQQVR